MTWFFLGPEVEWNGLDVEHPPKSLVSPEVELLEGELNLGVLHSSMNWSTDDFITECSVEVGLVRGSSSLKKWHGRAHSYSSFLPSFCVLDAMGCPSVPIWSSHYALSALKPDGYKFNSLKTMSQNKPLLFWSVANGKVTKGTWSFISLLLLPFPLPFSLSISFM